MSFSLVADHAFRRLIDVSPEFLLSRNIDLLLLDLDNTLAPYDEPLPSEETVAWASEMRAAGVTLFFVSNSHRPGRVEAFAEKLDIGWITDAGKPSPKAVRRALEICARPRERTALAGDQIFTDILCAGLSGITGILITPITFRPLKLSNILRALRYVGETPFRLLCRNKTWRSRK